MLDLIQDLCDFIAIPNTADEQPELDEEAQPPQYQRNQHQQQQESLLDINTSGLYPLYEYPPSAASFAVASDGLLVPVSQLPAYEFFLSCNILSAAIQQTTPEQQQQRHRHPASPASPVTPYRSSERDSSSPHPVHMYSTSPPCSTLGISSDITFAFASLLGGSSAPPGSAPGPANSPPSDSLLIQCVNCGTAQTSVWRKDDFGRSICNACGLYKKQRGIDRPAAFPFRKAVVRRRRRVKRANAVAVAAAEAAAMDQTKFNSWLDDLI
ncbi:Trans-acting T-cell-specific transcription factor GATA-3 [Physocladia obscura]|uniref:Trans-acting T-cell-specific transcription factor GATA-3 n=1 Tax=Physocladia obscura TaxID=109957 RepID=A0AAD5XDP7_9FUNG|nr:Trans-acting T-cell-specific transcription factor GATA-3 [Physocladia obscura]